MEKSGTESEGAIQIVVNEISDFRREVLSNAVSIQGFFWRIMIMRKKNSNHESLGFFLICNSKNRSSWECNVTASFALRVQKLSFHTEDIIRKISHTLNPYQYEMGYPNFIDWGDLLEPELGFIQDDSIKLDIIIQVNPAIEVNQVNPEKEFRKTLGLLLHDSRFSDFTVQTDAGTKFRVHKCIVAARSEYFGAMLSTDMLEASTNQTLVSGFSDAVVKGMLEYIYTGKTEILVEFAEELLRISDMYKLDGLKVVAGEEISSKLNVQNAAALFDAATLYNVLILKQKVTQFIKKNRTAVLNTEGFKKICKTNPDRIVELIEVICN